MATSDRFGFVDELAYSDADKGKVFRRASWGDRGIMFSWHSKQCCYAYCELRPINSKGDKKFYILFRDGADGVSKVGDGVLEASNIEEIQYNKGTEKMSKNVNYIGGDYNVVRVTYDLDAVNPIGSYNFKIDVAKKVKEGDMVVVEASNGYGLCRVEKIFERGLTHETIKEFNKATAWVVDVVDEELHNYKKEATDRKKFIVQQLEERKEQMEEIAIYKMLADSDPDAKKLLEELENLTSGKGPVLDAK